MIRCSWPLLRATPDVFLSLHCSLTYIWMHTWISSPGQTSLIIWLNSVWCGFSFFLRLCNRTLWTEWSIVFSFQEWLESICHDTDCHFSYLVDRPSLIAVVQENNPVTLSPNWYLISLLSIYSTFIRMIFFSSNSCSVKSLDILICLLGVLEGGVGNFSRPKRKEGFLFNSCELEPRMIGWGWELQNLSVSPFIQDRFWINMSQTLSHNLEEIIYSDFSWF